ncbi:hypothetical protein SI65_03707 [Aspergillus cristatus]|uniref:SGNH hydrolase-type esterase domain-containing protein n=1 Tax=Aspergillus cristatus TaxID=573508 RepID=A0A1E3BI81_ASPCR|nr:hypothetical protein SI65_03707 [Aspergillus cristatus]
MSTNDSETLYQPYDQFIVFGDSITQNSCQRDLNFGFFGALQDAYIRKLDVINRGFSGYNTAHAVKVFPKFFPTPETATVRFMTIFFGANDASLPRNAQYVPLDDYKKNLQTLVEHPATKAQNPRIILIAPPPINEYQLESFDASKGLQHPSRTAHHTKLYAEAAREVSASLNVPVADLWTAFMNATGWKEGQALPGSRDLPNDENLSRLLSDGLHFTSEGYKVMFDVVMETIRKNWPDQDPEKLPFVFPGWVDAPK